MFGLLSNLAETQYLNFRDPELFNDVRLMQFRRRKKCSAHLFVVVQSPAAQTAFVLELSKAITFWSYVLSW